METTNTNNGILLPSVSANNNWLTIGSLHDVKQKHPNFIEGPSSEIMMSDLTSKNIIPTFGDSTLTISHQKFIETTRKAAEVIFGNDNVSLPELRVSHPIIGRIPSAQHKKANELMENEKTIFYQRLAWIAQISSLTTFVNGQAVSLTIGGTRSYHEDKLYGKQVPQKFRIFIGFRVRVCSNMMLTCDGVSEYLNCMTEADIFEKAINLFQQFNAVKESTLYDLENLNKTWLSQEDFCKIIGRLRLYQALPVPKQKQLPKILLGDSVVNAATREYIKNPNFGIGEGSGSITCWQLMNLLNEAVKNSYTDLWIDRNQNCTDFAMGIANSLDGHDDKGYSWFLN